MNTDTGLNQAQLRQFYEAEKRLAKELRDAPRSERLELYAKVYDELYRSVPFHPQLQRKSAGHEAARERISRTLAFLRRFLRADMTYLEIGAGDCMLSFEVAKHVRRVYALDVSNLITASAAKPANVEVVISDGTSVPLSPNSVDVVLSDQLMEHLHPDDALEQLRNILSVMKKGARYVCITPNALSGPHDVSQYFDDIATGLHLKEYTYQELSTLFQDAGFGRVDAYIGHQRLGAYVRTPLRLVSRVESNTQLMVKGLSYEARRHTMRRLPQRLISDIRLVGTK